MKKLLLIAVLALTSVQASPQVNTGAIEGRVTRPGTLEGISDVQITLVGPSPAGSASALAALYTPNASLTPAMRDQIDALIASAPPTVTLEVVANAAIRMEANLLGLPAPALPNPNPAAGTPMTQPPQTGVITDREGLFSFKNLAPGRYQIRAQREGYFGAPPPGSVGIGAPTIVNTTATVVAGQPTPALSIMMLRGAIVSGRIRDPNGQPMSGAQVSAFQLNYQNGRRVLQSLNSKQTDDRGEYRLYWLPPGDYMIAVLPRRLINAVPSPQDNHARTFFPNVVDARTAQVVPAPEGAEISGMDITIRPDATGRISGRVVSAVTGPNGQPGIANTFQLISSDPKAFAEQGIGVSMPNSSPNRGAGQFELRGILPGEYDLLSNMPDGNGRQVWGRTRVSVGPGDLNDVTISIQPGVEVKARLTVDGAAPAYTMQVPPAGARGTFTTIVNGVVTTTTNPTQQAPAAPVPTPTYRVQLRSAEGSGLAMPFESAANQDMVYDPSGVFTFRSVLEGKYNILVQPLPPNAYISDVKAGGTSVFDSGVDFNSQTGEIQVVLNTNGIRIQGSVRDAAQRPVASARIALVPPESRRQNIQLYKTALSDASGNFLMTGVAPGDYKLFAWEAVPNSAWMSPEFLAPYEGRGQALKVGSTAATIELKLIPKEAAER